MKLTRRACALLGLLLGLALAHFAGALAVSDPYVRASIGLIVSAVVLTVWGVRACLAEYRAEQNRPAS